MGKKANITSEVSIISLCSFKYFVLMIALSFILAGCGGSGSDSSSGSTNTGSISTSNGITGTTDCYTCHADGQMSMSSGQVYSGGSVANATSSSDEGIFSLWLNGPHGNYEGIYHADNGVYNEGFPSYEYDGLGDNQTCLDCHDYGNDGSGLESFYGSTGISFLGVINRPIVGCESCHGSGADHFGIGEIVRAPGADACGACHDDGVGQTGNHLQYHPEGNNIYAYYQSSPHASSINSHNYETGSTTDVKAKCSKCHSDKGARLYKDIQGGYSELGTLLPSSLPPVENAENIQCRTCHDPHDPDRLLLQADSTSSAEYRTCTNCHQVSDGYHGENSSHSWSGHSVGVGTFDTERIIYDTHLKDDDTTAEIEGYNVDPSDSRVCRNCHNVHAVDNTINNDWADSAHGGHIIETVDSNGSASVTETEGPAWVHYDFKASNRQACQRCHTSTGFKNFASDPANYDPADNDFSYLTGEQREMLYCWACHINGVGGLRDPGAFVNIAPYSSPAARIAAVPDIGGSNICMSCHSGRESGQNIKDKDYATEINGKNFGSFNSHYLAAGGILFRTIGYEYDGRNYDNVVYFTHNQIGTTTDTDMGSNGPCVGCHMKGSNGHTFENVTKDAGGYVTDITAYDKVCSKCHASKTDLITRLNNLHDGYEAALDEIDTQLQAKGIYYGSGYPYYFKVASPKIVPNAFIAWPDKDTLGAAFNLVMLKHIDGAYAHNHEYTRKLIYDSIDFLDDGSLNASVEATLGGSGDAYDYLGGTR